MNYLLCSGTPQSGLHELRQRESVNCFSHVRLFETPWTVARQAPLFVGCSRQEYWSRLSFPSPVDIPDSENEPHLLLARWILYNGTTREAQPQSLQQHYIQ